MAESIQQAYVQVYTGNGKGKTTAAIGLAIRACGAGKRVLFLQFMKTKVYSEHKILPEIQGLTVETIGKPYFIAERGTLSPEEEVQFKETVVFFDKGHPPEDYVALAQGGYQKALEAVKSGAYDLVILDEYNVALYFNLLTWEETQALLDARRPEVELVFTGRRAPDVLVEAADLVTEMRAVKHYYEKGVLGRRGIEV